MSELAFEKIIGEVEHNLLGIQDRHAFLAGFFHELNRVTRGKPFDIWGASAWSMVGDHSSVLIINLASLAKGMYREGGFFGQVQARCLGELRRRRRWGGDERDHYVVGSYDSAQARAFQRLFPRASDVAKPSDVATQKNRLANLAEQIVAVRDNHLAHPYEHSSQKNTAALAAPDFEDIAAVFEGLQRMLNDLRLVSTGSTFAYPDPRLARVTEECCDIVDLVLNGTTLRMRWLAGNLDRDAFYSRLHALHESLGPDGGDSFNSASVIRHLRP